MAAFSTQSCILPHMVADGARVLIRIWVVDSATHTITSYFPYFDFVLFLSSISSRRKISTSSNFTRRKTLSLTLQLHKEGGPLSTASPFSSLKPWIGRNYISTRKYTELILKKLSLFQSYQTFKEGHLILSLFSCNKQASCIQSVLWFLSILV